jgi:hypothetical protein
VPGRAGARRVLRLPLPHEHQIADGEAKRNDEKFCHVAAWEYTGETVKPDRHVER